MSDGRDTIRHRLNEAGLDTARFIDVVDGEKKSVDHEQHPPDRVAGNYGIYANGDDQLVILDIDDYDDLEDKSGFSALSRLEPTLEQASPHGGTHRLYVVEATDDGRLVAAALSDAFGSANLKASWGEIRTSNQYVVGAGSKLDGCGKDWCSDCADPDGGHYAIQSDEAIATLSAETLIDVLSADPELSKDDTPADRPERQRPRHRSDDVDIDVYDVLTRAYEPGERHSHPVHGSDTGTNFKVDEDRETWRCWRHSCTGNALHLVGMEEGIVECGDWQGSGLSSETWAEIFEAARDRDLDVGAPPEDFDSTTNYDESEVDRGVAILESQTDPEAPVGDLTYHNGGYGIPWEYRDDDGNITKNGVDLVCNFTLETLSFLSVEGQQIDEFVVRVHPNHPTEQPYDVRIPPSVFNSSDTFRSEVVTGRTTWFDPSNRKGPQTVSILRYLRETVGAQPAPHREGQPYVGLSDNGEEYVTPAGSLTADGWTDEADYEFYSIGGAADEKGPLAQKWQLGPDVDIQVDEAVVARVCELLPRIRTTDRGLPILGWFYAAPVKAYIQQWEREFPLLAPHGDTGTGKTSTLETYVRLFGGDGEPLSSTDTKFTIQKHLAESRGYPIWVDEYKPTELPEGKKNHLHQRLKEVTKERTMPKGRPDLGMDALHMRAPVVVSGEQKIDDPAVRRRSILTNLSREPTQDGTETKAAFGELTGTAYEDADGDQHYPEGYDLRQHARAYHEWVLAQGEDDLRDRWVDARERVKDILDRRGVTVESSEEHGLQTVLFGVRLFRDFAGSYGADETALPTDADLYDACGHVIQNIGVEGQRREHADEFLEVLSLAATEGYVDHGVHHRVYETNDGEVLAVHMPSSFTAVKRFVRESNLEDEYTILSKGDYSNSWGNKANVSGSYVVETNKRTRKIENGARAVHFDHERIDDKLGADFNIDSFRLDAEEGGESTVESDDDDPGDGDAPMSLDAVEPGFVTVEARLASKVDPKPWLEAEGTLDDGTAKVNVVARDENLLVNVDQGDEVRVGDALAEHDQDGVLQLELRPGVTQVSAVGADAQQSGLDAHEGSEAAADGGEVPDPAPDGEGPAADAQRLASIVAEHQGSMSRGALFAQAANRFDIDPDSAETALEKAVEEQRIAETPEGEYDV